MGNFPCWEIMIMAITGNGSPMRNGQNNMQLLYKIHKEMGFNLLLNESDIMPVNGDRLALIGVENWGLPPFKQYGDLETIT